MVSLWYPARRAQHYPIAPLLSPGAAAQFKDDYGLPQDAVVLPTPHGHDGAPVDRSDGRLPVVLYSHGFNSVRSFNTLVVEELASRGYIVVTIDHTHEAAEVEFPDGRVEVNATGPGNDDVYAASVDVRVADIQFVLDQLEVIARGGNPDAEQRALPAGLRHVFDLRKVGMFGHSLGGAATSSAMFADSRIKAGLSLDGGVYGPVIDAGLDRPFMRLSSPRGHRSIQPRVASFWSHLRGWRRDLHVPAAGHLTFGDFHLYYSPLLPLLNPSEEDIESDLGSIEVERVVAIQRAYPRAFFDLHLRHRGHLLDAPSPAYPEVLFVP
jgi:predicted dienelactone hydrolase